MKKMLVSLFALVALAISSQTTFAACPCSDPCPACPVITPCCPTLMPVPCPACPILDPCGCAGEYQSYSNSCCDDCGKKQCRWWKFWENKNCCYKCNKCCDCCD